MLFPVSDFLYLSVVGVSPQSIFMCRDCLYPILRPIQQLVPCWETNSRPRIERSSSNRKALIVDTGLEPGT